MTPEDFDDAVCDALMLLRRGEVDRAVRDVRRALARYVSGRDDLDLDADDLADLLAAGKPVVANDAVGWRCPHFAMTNTGIRGTSAPRGWCGCLMQPIPGRTLTLTTGA